MHVFCNQCIIRIISVNKCHIIQNFYIFMFLKTPWLVYHGHKSIRKLWNLWIMSRGSVESLSRHFLDFSLLLVQLNTSISQNTCKNESKLVFPWLVPHSHHWQSQSMHVQILCTTDSHNSPFHLPLTPVSVELSMH